MNKKDTACLAVIVALMFSFVSIAEAQTVNTQALSPKQQSIVTIAAFTAKGDLEKLKIALNEGLDAGLTINEIKEILVQMYAYTGFPRSLNAISTFITVMDERGKKGLRDELGREASPLPSNKSRIELGTEIQTRLIGAPATGGYIAFTPAIDEFLKGHLFGDIFGRDNVGLSQAQMRSLISVIESRVGKKEADNAFAILEKVITARG
jgi:4-carboxymuconolactone decarboxylase